MRFVCLYTYISGRVSRCTQWMNVFFIKQKWKEDYDMSRYLWWWICSFDAFRDVWNAHVSNIDFESKLIGTEMNYLLFSSNERRTDYYFSIHGSLQILIAAYVFPSQFNFFFWKNWFGHYYSIFQLLHSDHSWKNTVIWGETIVYITIHRKITCCHSELRHITCDIVSVSRTQMA